MAKIKLTVITLDPDLDPWERQPGETPARHGQFTTYRDLGRTRNLAKTAAALSLNAGHIRQVAAANLWVQRAEAFDRHRDELHQQTWLEERRRAAERDARILDVAVAKVAQRLATLTPDELSPADLVRLLDVVLKHRRGLFGDPQMTVAVTGPAGDPLQVRLAEFEAMGAEQRRLAIEEAMAKVQRRLQAVAGGDDDDE